MHVSGLCVDSGEHANYTKNDLWSDREPVTFLLLGDSAIQQYTLLLWHSIK